MSEQQAISSMKEELEKYSDKTDSFFDKTIPITADLGFLQSSEWKGTILAFLPTTLELEAFAFFSMDTLYSFCIHFHYRGDLHSTKTIYSWVLIIIIIIAFTLWSIYYFFSS